MARQSLVRFGDIVGHGMAPVYEWLKERKIESVATIRTHSGVVAPKSATSRPLPSKPGVHTQCRSLPISIPATLARTMGSPAMDLVLPGLSPLFRLFRILATFPNTTAQLGDTRILP